MVLGLKGLGCGESRASVCSVSVIGMIKNNHINHRGKRPYYARRPIAHERKKIVNSLQYDVTRNKLRLPSHSVDCPALT